MWAPILHPQLLDASSPSYFFFSKIEHRGSGEDTISGGRKEEERKFNLPSSWPEPLCDSTYGLGIEVRMKRQDGGSN